MAKLIFKQVVWIFVLCCIKISTTYAAFLSNNFLVTSRVIESDKSTKSCKCHIQMFYPEFSSNDENVAIKINTIIHNFVEKYNLICNKKHKINNYKITFDVRSGSKEYFSIRWIGKSGDKLTRIDTLTFKIADGKLVMPEDVFRPLSRNFMPELVKLSNNHLASNTNWSKFLDKIKTSEIQYYIFESDWYIIFNSRANKDLVEVKLPRYFVR